MIAIQIYVLVETQNWDSGVVRKSNPRTATGWLSASPLLHRCVTLERVEPKLSSEQNCAVGFLSLICHVHPDKTFLILISQARNVGLRVQELI